MRVRPRLRVPRSRTMHPQSPPLIIRGTVLKKSDDLVILGVTFDSKMTFEKHLRWVSRAASQRLGILRKSWRVFYDRSLLGTCFGPIHTDTHLKLLDRAIGSARFQTGGGVRRPNVYIKIDIAHRLSAAVLCMM